MEKEYLVVILLVLVIVFEFFIGKGKIKSFYEFSRDINIKSVIVISILSIFLAFAIFYLENHCYIKIIEKLRNLNNTLEINEFHIVAFGLSVWLIGKPANVFVGIIYNKVGCGEKGIPNEDDNKNGVIDESPILYEILNNTNQRLYMVKAKSEDTFEGKLKDDIDNHVAEWIGFLERIIILLLIMVGGGELGASIGLIFAAKTIARYKELDNKEFAKKYLLGTLLSMLFAILVTQFLCYLIF